jgi:hypothetical protein
MIPNNEGQIVKFHTLLPGEDPDQMYVVLELHTDCDIPRAKIKALNTGLALPPISTVSPGDLEVVPVPTNDLIGYRAFIQKSDGKKVLGKIISIEESEIYADLTLIDGKVETNVVVSVEDKDGQIHTGTLVI